MADINVQYFTVANSEIDTIIKMGIELTTEAMEKTHTFASEEYANKNGNTKLAILNFCASKCGMKCPENKRDLVALFSNATFESLFNTIIAEVQSGVQTRVTPEGLMALADVVEVDCGDSYSFEIDTKGLPAVQRASLTTNLSLLDGHAMQSITVTPVPYACSTSLDFIRVLANDYDFGKEMARVARAIMYAQYKAVAGLIFNTAIAGIAPLYQATFASNNYVKMAETIGALNNAPVTSYGTLTAWNAISALATQGGFTTKDDYIRNGFLQKIYGVDSMVIDNIADLSAPLSSTLAAVQLGIPTNVIVMASGVGDKPVKLVRENYVRVQKGDPNGASLNRITYKYFASWDAAIATQAHFGVQNTTAAG